MIELRVNESALLQRVETRAAEMRARGEEVRVDDTPEVLVKRLASYRSLTEPLIHYYSERRKLLTVDGMMTIEHVTHEIGRILTAIGAVEPKVAQKAAKKVAKPAARAAAKTSKSAQKASAGIGKAAKAGSRSAEKGSKKASAKKQVKKRSARAASGAPKRPAARAGKAARKAPKKAGKRRA